MSAAATAAGYLYASGRLRGRDRRLVDHERRAAGKPLERRQPKVTYKRRIP